MKRTVLFSGVILGLFLLCAACTGNHENSEEDRAVRELMEVLEASTQEEVQGYYCHDFEGSGSLAMYALTGKEGETGGCRLWYVTTDTAKLADDVYKAYLTDKSAAITIDDQLVFLKLETGDGGSDSTSYLWSARDGQPFQTEISGKGGWLYQNEYGEIVLCQSAFDSLPDSAKHTWKPYYYYWDGERFREYGAIRIALEALSRLDGAAKALEENIYTKENAEIQDIFYRDNQIININFTYGGPEALTYDSITLRYEDETAAFVRRDGGVYEAAFLPDLAVYPANVRFAAQKEIDTQEVVQELTKTSRFVGTEENRLAGEYLVDCFIDIGLEPMNGVTYKWNYTQDVEGQAYDLFNVVGILPGKDRTKATFITSHFDSERNTPGAVDNASGVAAMLRVAQNLAAKKNALAGDVIICSYNGEEQYYQGSLAIVDALLEGYESVENINLDCVGMVDGGHYMLGYNPGEVSADLVNAFQKVVYANSIPYSIVLNSAVRADHKAFLSRRKPAVTLTQFNLYTVAHTPNDTIDLLDFEALNLISDLTAQVVLERQGAPAE